MKKIIEKPDLLQYEDDNDIIVARPKGWEIVIFEKDTGNNYVKGTYEDREKMTTVFMEEIGESTEVEYDFTDDDDDDLKNEETLEDLKEYFDEDVKFNIGGWNLKIVHPGIFMWTSDDYEDIIYANPLKDIIIFRVYDKDEEEIEDLAKDISFEYDDSLPVKENANKYLKIIDEKLKELEDELKNGD